MNEEIVYEYLSSSFTDLVHKVVLSRMSQSTTDDYERVIFKAIEDNRMVLSRCDYYDKLKCFCITFSPEMVEFGVQAISVYPKTGCYITVTAPGKFYSHERKKSMIRYVSGFKYLYNIGYAIITSPLMEDDSCDHSRDWKVDDCKLKYINNIIINQFNCTVPWLLHFSR